MPKINEVLDDIKTFVDENRQMLDEELDGAIDAIEIHIGHENKRLVYRWNVTE